jgi:polyisoprenoid-binding protein YceI
MEKIIYISLVFALVLFTGGCVAKKTTAPAENKDKTAKEQAAVNNNASEQTNSQAKKAGEPESYLISPADSKVNWYSKKILADTKHNGTVLVKEGYVTMADGELTGGEISIDMSTIKDKDMEGKPSAQTLENHLMSEDFFDVAKYPTANFVIKSVVKKSEENGRVIYGVTGDMRIKEKTNSVSFDAKVLSESGKISLLADFSIDRTLWEVKYGSGKFFKGLGDNLIDDIIEYKLDLVSSI